MNKTNQKVCASVLGEFHTTVSSQELRKPKYVYVQEALPFLDELEKIQAQENHEELQQMFLQKIRLNYPAFPKEEQITTYLQLKDEFKRKSDEISDLKVSYATLQQMTLKSKNGEFLSPSPSSAAQTVLLPSETTLAFKAALEAEALRSLKEMTAKFQQLQQEHKELEAKLKRMEARMFGDDLGLKHLVMKLYASP